MLLVEMQIRTTTVGSGMEVPQNTKNKTTILSRDITPGHTPEEMWSRIR
jgi:hypothetical protein